MKIKGAMDIYYPLDEMTKKSLSDASKTIHLMDERWVELKELYRRFNVAMCELRFNKDTKELAKLYCEIEKVAIELGYNKEEPKIRSDT